MNYSFGNPLFNKVCFKLFGQLSFKPERSLRGQALLYYTVEPFLYTEKDLPQKHTNLWECREMAASLLAEGFSVDIVPWQNKTFTPRKPYDVVIDIHDSLPRLAPHLAASCIKIYHITGAHWLQCITAEYTRLSKLKERRGVALLPRRIVSPDFNPEAMNAATILGNKFTQETFAYAKKPLHRVPISTTHTYPSSSGKNWAEARKHFLWFGSSGLVHKGLDLVLEAFAAMPEYSLTVVGPVHKEKDFTDLYHKELYETPNIQTLGWLDPGSASFKTVLDTSAYLVYPSCSEGGGGSVVTAMHGGLIPIVTPESSVDIGDFGYHINSVTIEGIQEQIKVAATQSAEEVERRGVAAWNYARKHHTKESFSAAYREALSAILKKHGK